MQLPCTQDLFETSPVVLKIEEVTSKEVQLRAAKLALLLIKFMKYRIVQFLIDDNFEESPYCAYIPNINR